jgi:hypothetical protein
MVTVMTFNLAPGQIYVRMVRPRILNQVRETDRIPNHTSEDILIFSRSEWAVFVLSGLKAALESPGGWKLWDEASAHRGPLVAEKDHLLVIASLLTQGRDLGQTYEYLPGHRQAAMAIRKLARLAANWRAQEGISTPLQVFPDGSARLPDPAFETPYLENLVEKTHIETLLDLARHGEEATFKDLAQTLGVPAEKLDELWTGTVRRVQ